MPAAGPCSPIPAPLPAGLEIPGPACMAVGVDVAPGALVPSLAAGSEGGGPSTEHETTVAPRMIASPSMRFSSVSMTCPAWPAPGAPLVLLLRLTLRNSSQSARTRFMCYYVLADSTGEHSREKQYLIKCQHLSNKLSSIVHGGSHSVVDLAQCK